MASTGRASRGANADSEPPGIDFLGGRYRDGKLSGLRLTVPEGGGELPAIVLR